MQYYEPVREGRRPGVLVQRGCRIPASLFWRASQSPIRPTAFVQGLEARGVGEAQVAFAEGAEAGARYRRHAGLVQQPRLQRPGIESGARDVREGIEGAAWVGAAEPGQRAQRRDDVGAPFGKCRNPSAASVPAVRSGAAMPRTAPTR